MKHGMRMRGVFAGLLAALFALPEALAHCPLCTIGAAAAAGGANYLGVSQFGIGVFIGAFAVSIGWWVSNILPKQYIKWQREVLILFSFVTTIVPLLVFFTDIFPLYISLWGAYGSFLNRTYIPNLFLVGSIVGGALVALAPWLSKRLTAWRLGKQIPFQGILLTFVLLFVTAGLAQVLL